MLSRRAITIEQDEELAHIKTSGKKAKFLYQNLSKRDDSAFEIFLEALRECDQEFIAKHLEKSLQDLEDTNGVQEVSDVVQVTPEDNLTKILNDLKLPGAVIDEITEEYSHQGKLRRRTVSFRSDDRNLIDDSWPRSKVALIVVFSNITTCIIVIVKFVPFLLF